MAGEHDHQTGVRVDARRALAKLRAAGEEIDPHTLLDVIGMRQLHWINQNLKAAGLDNPWQQMSDWTLRERPQRPSPRHFASRYQTLLQQSMIHEVSSTEEAVDVGTAAKWARFHHLGDRARQHPLPSRKLIPSPQRARALAMALISAAVERVRQKGRA